MNPERIIGLAILVIGIASCVVALVLRTRIALVLQTRTSWAKLLRYLFLAGLPVCFLVSAAGFWDCYASRDWTKCLAPIGFLLLAVNGLVSRRQCIALIDGLLITKKAVDNGKSAVTDRDSQ